MTPDEQLEILRRAYEADPNPCTELAVMRAEARVGWVKVGIAVARDGARTVHARPTANKRRCFWDGLWNWTPARLHVSEVTCRRCRRKLGLEE